MSLVPSILRRRFFSDIAVVAALVAVIGVEAASLVSVSDDLSMSPGGLVLVDRCDDPAGIAVAEPSAAPPIDGRIARCERATDTPAASQTL